MYLLVFAQNNREVTVGLFDSIENGRRFVSKIPGYKISELKDGEEIYVYELLEVDKLPDYTEAEYKGNLVPVTRHMFPDTEDVDIIWRSIPYMETEGKGLTDNFTFVDAYVIDNVEAEAYIRKREDGFKRVREAFERHGFRVMRAYAGSEDGEAILATKNDDDWHFVTHMDPIFVDELPDDEEEIIKALLPGHEQ